jgi:hypothetical protein
MRLSEVKIGVSRLPDGTAVLTPFGRLGGVYRFDATLAGRFDRLMGVLLWSGAIIAAGLVGAGALHRLDPRQEATLLVLVLVALDALRVLLVKALFRGAEPVPAPKRRPEADRLAPVADLRRRALVPLLVAEALLFAVAWARLLAGEIEPSFPFALAACHGLVYANRRFATLTER